MEVKSRFITKESLVIILCEDTIFFQNGKTFLYLLLLKRYYPLAMQNRYADIVLPLAQPAYCYSVPEGVELREGDAVAVQFGVRHFYTGIVWRLTTSSPM